MVSAHVSAPYVIAGSTQQLYACLFKHILVLLLKMLWCLASSLNLLVLVFVSGAVSLPQVDVSFNVLNLSGADTC